MNSLLFFSKLKMEYGLVLWEGVYVFIGISAYLLVCIIINQSFFTIIYFFIYNMNNKIHNDVQNVFIKKITTQFLTTVTFS